MNDRKAVFPEITWLTNGHLTIDYRPTVDRLGNIVFERQVVDADDTQRVSSPVLYKLAGGEARPLLPTLDAVQTRADYCWTSGRLAFNARRASQKRLSVWTFDESREGPEEIPNTVSFLYPQWTPDGSKLVVMNDDRAIPGIHPRSSAIDLAGGIVLANLNGKLPGLIDVFAGMPAVDPINEGRIAFAGQPAKKFWTETPHYPPVYDQNANYIFINRPSTTPTAWSSYPMEPDAILFQFQKQFQGRAPAWSPDGRHIVFESNRNSPENRYAIYLFDTARPDAKAVQLTDPAENDAQHAKFCPDGRRLVFSASPNGRFSRIASIDISDRL